MVLRGAFRLENSWCRLKPVNDKLGVTLWKKWEGKWKLRELCLHVDIQTQKVGCFFFFFGKCPNIKYT